ncbi:MAG: hypothetical protein BWY50_01788 [Spirochaetes bacterium ADurb.Bin315]|nr:MAG: hypothetical protein BWY50_01788 [Spirochaetes bacterium ADurb.Bin315]
MIEEHRIHLPGGTGQRNDKNLPFINSDKSSKTAGGSVRIGNYLKALRNHRLLFVRPPDPLPHPLIEGFKRQRITNQLHPGQIGDDASGPVVAGGAQPARHKDDIACLHTFSEVIGDRSVIREDNDPFDPVAELGQLTADESSVAIADHSAGELGTDDKECCPGVVHRRFRIVVTT